MSLDENLNDIGIDSLRQLATYDDNCRLVRVVFETNIGNEIMVYLCLIECVETGVFAYAKKRRLQGVFLVRESARLEFGSETVRPPYMVVLNCWSACALHKYLRLLKTSNPAFFSCRPLLEEYEDEAVHGALAGEENVSINSYNRFTKTYW